MYCVAIAFKMTEQVKQWICIRFWGTLNIPLWKLFGWFRSVRLWAAGVISTTDWLTHHVLCSLLDKYQNTRWLSPLQPRCGALQLLVLSKTQIIFGREEIPGCQWDSRKYDRTADGNWENRVRSQDASFDGDWCIIVQCAMFLIFPSINVSNFHITWLDMLYIHTHISI